MHPRISIRGCVHWSVCTLVGLWVGLSVLLSVCLTARLSVQLSVHNVFIDPENMYETQKILFNTATKKIYRWGFETSTICL